jgi:hypothetical protein
MLMEADEEEAAAVKEKEKKREKELADLKKGKKPKVKKPKINKKTGKAFTKDELEAEELANKKDIVFVKPFLSIITVSKCVMIVGATFFVTTLRHSHTAHSTLLVARCAHSAPAIT